MGALVTPAAAARRALALCAHVERFAYERVDVGMDASPHFLAGATRLLVRLCLPDADVARQPAAPPEWNWYAGSSPEWYEHGPFSSSKAAVEALAGEAGYLVEGLSPDPIVLDAAALLEAQYFETNDAFDYERSEPERIGDAAEIAIADAELQTLLDGWAAKYGHTFARGSIFAATRSAERIEAWPPADAPVVEAEAS